MKEINLKDSIYLVFYPEQDMDEASKEVMKTFVSKVFGNDSKLYFTDESEVEVFIKPKEGEKEKAVTPEEAISTPKNNPDKVVKLDPMVVAAKARRAKASGLPPGVLGPNGTFL